MDESKPDRSSVGSPSHHKETHGRGEDIDADTPIGDFKGPNIFHRAKEEIEAIVDTYQSKRESDKDAATPKKQADNKGSPRHRKETHGRGDGIDADTPISEFKGPNVFHRAKEEFVAIVETVQSKKESERAAAPPKKIADSKGSPRHRKETHGRGEDIDADTPINEFKGPNVFYRAKEEFAAIVETVQSKRESERAAATLKKQSLPADYRGNPSHRKETRGKGDDIDPDTPINEFKGPNIFHRAKEEIQAIADTIQSKKESDKDVETPKKDGLRASISKKLQKSRNRD